jgi:hypothetical protein
LHCTVYVNEPQSPAVDRENIRLLDKRGKRFWKKFAMLPYLLTGGRVSNFLPLLIGPLLTWYKESDCHGSSLDHTALANTSL